MHNVESCVCRERKKKTEKECTKYGKGVWEGAVQKKRTKFRSGFFVIIEL